MDAATLHIGHHFFGAGNCGDDFMLAGFLDAWRRAGVHCHLTCCVPDAFRPSQQRRFPQIEWLAYEPAVRAEAIRNASVWLGLGGSPFQSDSGPWFLTHLGEEVETCRRLGKPMYFLGVGVNDRAALATPQARAVLDHATHLWTRDEQSAALLTESVGPTKVTSGADLAHVYLRGRPAQPPRPGTLGFVLNFEQRRAFCTTALARVLASARAAGRSPRWLVQDHRRYDFFELAVHDLLPRDQTQLLPIFLTDYEFDTTDELLTRWPTPEVLVTSRYHAGIVGAWMGARLVTIERNVKVTGLARQLGVRTTLSDLLDSAAITAAIDASRTIELGRLTRLADSADACCRQFFACLPQRRFRNLVQRAQSASARLLQSFTRRAA